MIFMIVWFQVMLFRFVMVRFANALYSLFSCCLLHGRTTECAQWNSWGLCMSKRIKLSNNKKRRISQLLATAGLAMQQGDFSACSAACDEIESLYPAHADVLHLRGLMAMGQAQLEQAVGYINQAIQAAPARADIIASLGNLHLQAGAVEAAQHCYRQALAVDAHDIATHLGMAASLMAQHEYEQAIDWLEQTRKRKPGDISVRLGLFQACHAVNRYADAEQHLQAILVREPDHAEALYSMGILMLEQGKLEESERFIRHCIHANPFQTDAWRALADFRRYTEEDDETAAMQMLYEQCPAGSDMRMAMAFTLAKVMDDLGQYDRAFSLLAEANNLRHDAGQADRLLAGMDEVAAVCNAQVLADAAAFTHPPVIFVVGMPRSGTTLVEQMLAMHPDVTSLGESGHFEAAITETLGKAGVMDPVLLNSLSREQCESIGHGYIERIQHACGKQPCYTDKTLSHTRLIGLIRRALPNALFIHVQRHPLDTCLSIYKSNLQGTHFAYGSNLSALARYYAATAQLMDYWHSVLPAEIIHGIAYEQLVAQPQVQLRALLAACRLEWSERCMDFQHAGHAVQTASAVQVRKPLNANSIGIWKHYRQHLQPLHNLLCEEPELR